MKCALTIAGSDSICGAGVQLDLRVFRQLGVYGTSCITAITAQNSLGISQIAGISPKIISAQLEAIVQDLPIAACKTGMLLNSQIVRCVAENIQKYRLKNLVVDPVIYAKDGTRLLQKDAIKTLKQQLLPLARLITPNIIEMQILSGLKIDSAKALNIACRRLAIDYGSEAVLVTGYMVDNYIIDVLFFNDNLIEFKNKIIKTATAVHGTGCALSAGICALLALGYGLEAAVSSARRKLRGWLLRGSAIKLGKGYKLLTI